jgi:hypothetical protein
MTSVSTADHLSDRLVDRVQRTRVQRFEGRNPNAERRDNLVIRNEVISTATSR